MKNTINLTGKPSIDKPWLHYYPEGASEVALPQATAYQYLYACNEGYDGIALEYFDAKISYSALFKRIDAVANSFTALGVQKGEFVTICIPNTPEAISCFYGLNKIGAVANMVSPSFSAEDILSTIHLTDCKVLIILDKFFAALKKSILTTKIERIIIVSSLLSLSPVVQMLSILKERPITIPQDECYLSWKEFIKAGKKTFAKTAKYEPNMPAVIVHSSGSSTGTSKDVIMPNEAFIGLAIQIKAMNPFNLGKRSGLRSLVNIPLFISTGLNAVINLQLTHSSTLILIPEFTEETFIKGIMEYKPNYAFTTPSHYKSLLHSDIKDLSYLKYPFAGGEALPKALEESLNAFLAKCDSSAHMWKGWGMCELGSAVTQTTGDEQDRKGVGKPYSHTTVGVFDTETDEEVGYNRRGEIRVISPTRMLRYYKNPEATAQFFKIGLDGQSWGCTGDIGHIDEEGNLFVEGRINDFILNAAGEKIWLFDIETVVFEHDSVQLCEAVGLSTDEGEVPVIHLVLKQGFTGSAENILKEIHERCIATLSPDAIPLGYKIRESFDILPTGKRDTLSLKNERDLIWVTHLDSTYR